MSKTVSPRVTLCTYSDDPFRGLFLKWFSDPEIRRANEIPSDADAENVLLSMDLCSDAVYVVMADGVSIGFIALIKQNDGFFQVPITIADKSYRRKGIGKRALRLATPPVVGGQRINYVQKIRPENKAMLIVSNACGFRPVRMEGQFVRMEKRG